MEAVIGALYLDGGFDAAHDFIHRFILSDLENKILFYDSKTVLQEILQAEGDGEFSYELKRRRSDRITTNRSGLMQSETGK